MKGRKVSVAVLSVVLAAAALTGCGSAQQTNGPKKTRVVLNEVAHSLFYAPMYVAIEEGYFADAGIDLELVTGFGADKTMTAVLTGEADISQMPVEYAPQVTKMYNAANCEALGVTIPDGYEPMG